MTSKRIIGWLSTVWLDARRQIAMMCALIFRSSLAWNIVNDDDFAERSASCFVAFWLAACFVARFISDLVYADRLWVFALLFAAFQVLSLLLTWFASVRLLPGLLHAIFKTDIEPLTTKIFVAYSLAPIFAIKILISALSAPFIYIVVLIFYLFVLYNGVKQLISVDDSQTFNCAIVSGLWFFALPPCFDFVFDLILCNIPA